MNPYAIIAAGVLALGLAVGGFTFGMRYESGQHARTEQLVADVREQAQLGAADAIARQKPIQKIIQQKLETVTREVPVYRDCRNTPDVVRLLDDALAGRPDSAGSVELPAADAAQ